MSCPSVLFSPYLYYMFRHILYYCIWFSYNKTFQENNMRLYNVSLDSIYKITRLTFTTVIFSLSRSRWRQRGHGWVSANWNADFEDEIQFSEKFRFAFWQPSSGTVTEQDCPFYIRVQQKIIVNNSLINHCLWYTRHGVLSTPRWRRTPMYIPALYQLLNNLYYYLLQYSVA